MSISKTMQKSTTAWTIATLIFLVVSFTQLLAQDLLEAERLKEKVIQRYLWLLCFLAQMVGTLGSIPHVLKGSNLIHQGVTNETRMCNPSDGKPLVDTSNI